MPTKTTASKATEASTLPKVLKAGTEYNIPHTLITIKENIRSNANVIDQKMLQSIRENGINSPLMVTPDYVHIDGERRLHCCDVVAKERGVPYIEVPVIVRDIPENQIPIVQFTLQERKNITTADTNRACYLHAERNPNVQLKELAELFHISKTTAFRCVRIQKAPTINKLVTGGKLTQNAALAVIDHFLAQSGANEENEYDEASTIKGLENAEELGKALEANIAANVKRDKEDKEIPQPAWHIRNINTYLNSVGKPPIETKKSGEKGDAVKKFNLPALVQGMLDSFVISPTEDGKVSFTGSLTQEQFEALKELSQEKKKGELIEIASTNVEQSTFDTWQEYSNFYPDRIVVVQDSITRYRLYEGSMQIVEEVLKIEPTFINGAKAYTAIAKKDMRTITTQLLNKGWSVVRINKENAKSRLKSSQQEETATPDTDDLTEELNNELKDISAGKTPVAGKASKLQEKLSTRAATVIDEDEEFDRLQAGTNFDDFIEGIEGEEETTAS